MLFVRLFDLRMFGFIFPPPLRVWEGLWFVIVPLPGLFSYFIFPTDRSKAVPLLKFCFVCASVVSYAKLFLPYSFLIFPSFVVLAGAVLITCDISFPVSIL